mmetsp:Transcript_2151/g.4813  ORF Transcript_2151/g.4813 Transcript_2151/m.4813 type:complete len:368 (-) Transcript_2151:680-1783(-)
MASSSTKPVCSSNGEAAASLSAMFAAQAALSADAGGSSTDGASSSTDGGSSAGSAGGLAPSPLPGSATSPSKLSAAEPWRLKFLHKVGVAEQRGSSEGSCSATGAYEAPELYRRTDLAETAPEEGAREEVVRVRQAISARRSSDDIRLAYIKKLENSRAFIPQLSRPKTAQTVTIFDWDDTLLCTTHLEMQQRQHGAIPAQVREQLAGLERVVTTLLTQASKVGKVFIITNASEGWVQHSAQMCLPNLAPHLQPVLIISARAGFEAAFPGDSHAWKMHAFLQVQNKLHLEAVTNLVSVGDSHIEMDAVHLLGRSFAHALVKTVKLWERPTPYELQKQLEVVAEKLPEIYRSGTTLNIWLEREQQAAA